MHVLPSQLKIFNDKIYHLFLNYPFAKKGMPLLYCFHQC